MSYTKIKNDLANGFKLASESKGASKATEHSFKAEFNKRTHSSEWSHHANAQQGKKAITVDQAQRLAKYAPIIQECAKKYNVPVALVCGVILQESGGNAKASSPAGAKGLMQLMPQTAKRFGVTSIMDPKQNIEGGTKYLRFLMDRFHGDYRLVCAGYNAGEKNVEKYGNKIPPFAETRNYVPSVLAYADSVHNMLRGTTAVSTAAAVAEPKQIQLNPILPHYKRA